MRKTSTKVMLLIAFAFFLNFFSEASQLYVDTNYHPYDDKILRKITAALN
ncbi:hypothetical protein GQR60_04260 [Labilibaculum sp. A4]|nr:hypothetical protein [Labilibaculum euxinus]MDQ1772053.1 hypothetical protein [Labilibaculum euxinus]MWN75549.1 hypothetical protein [Labilibaculum euxinus]